MPGTPTPYYGFPIPAPTDPANAPSDFQALAQKIEDTLKNGYTIPSGNLTVGDLAGTTQRTIGLNHLFGADTYSLTMGLGSGAGDQFAMVMKKNNVEVARLSLTAAAVLNILSGAVYRPLPFATWCGRTSIALSNAVSGTVAITLPTGRFTAPENNTVGWVANATTIANYDYYAAVTAGTNTSVTVGIRHFQATAASITVNVMVTIVQMTPTSGPG